MTFTAEDAERFARDALRLHDRIERAVDLIEAGGPVEAVRAILTGGESAWGDDGTPPQAHWWIYRCHRAACTVPWVVAGPRPDEFPTWPEALAYVDAQIRARALTALEGQP